MRSSNYCFSFASCTRILIDSTIRERLRKGCYKERLQSDIGGIVSKLLLSLILDLILILRPSEKAMFLVLSKTQIFLSIVLFLLLLFFVETIFPFSCC